MKIYRLGKPHPVLIGFGRMELLPVRNPSEPVSGYALQIDGHVVELSFEELGRIAEASKEVARG